MRWVPERGRQAGPGVTAGSIELGLDQEDAFGEVCTSYVGSPQIGTGDVGHPQVGASQVRANQSGTSQARSAQVSALEVSPDEVSAPMILPVANACPDELAGGQKEVIDVPSMRHHIELDKRLRAQSSETLALPPGPAEILAQCARRWQRKGLGHIPEELMQVPHDRESREHLLGDSRVLPPVLTAEGDLRDLLPRPETVIDGATSKTLLSQSGVYAAARVRLQVGTGVPGGLVDRKVRRDREGRNDAAQPEAARAVSPQADAILSTH